MIRKMTSGQCNFSFDICLTADLNDCDEDNDCLKKDNLRRCVRVCLHLWRVSPIGVRFQVNQQCSSPFVTSLNLSGDGPLAMQPFSNATLSQCNLIFNSSIRSSSTKLRWLLYTLGVFQCSLTSLR